MARVDEEVIVRFRDDLEVFRGKKPEIETTRDGGAADMEFIWRGERFTLCLGKANFEAVAAVMDDLLAAAKGAGTIIVDTPQPHSNHAKYTEKQVAYTSKVKAAAMAEKDGHFTKANRPKNSTGALGPFTYKWWLSLHPEDTWPVD